MGCSRRKRRSISLSKLIVDRDLRAGITKMLGKHSINDLTECFKSNPRQYGSELNNAINKRLKETYNNMKYLCSRALRLLKTNQVIDIQNHLDLDLGPILSNLEVSTNNEQQKNEFSVNDKLLTCSSEPNPISNLSLFTKSEDDSLLNESKRKLSLYFDDESNEFTKIKKQKIISKQPAKSQAVKSFQCIHCLVSFSRNFNLKRHLKIHQRKPSICIKCKRKFKHKHSKIAHEKKCIESNENTKKNRNAKKHIKRRQHNPITCDVCNEISSCSEEYRKHKHLHNSKKYQCTVCKQKFQTSRQLTNHRYYQTNKAKKPPAAKRINRNTSVSKKRQIIKMIRQGSNATQIKKDTGASPSRQQRILTKKNNYCQNKKKEASIKSNRNAKGAKRPLNKWVEKIDKHLLNDFIDMRNKGIKVDSKYIIQRSLQYCKDQDIEMPKKQI